MKKEISQQFNYDILKGYKRICVACSGGMDSVAMLKVLSDYRQEEKFELYAVNIDHDLRETSKRDSLFVKKLCKSLNVTLFFKKVKVKAIAKQKKMGIEECAREERYNFFRQLIEDNVVDAIVLAHHNQDDIETMLMNLSRGCFLNGLYGIKEKRNDFLRPMLSVTKGEIREYISANNLEYMEDETNDDTIYSRNFVRKEILPKILAKFPTFEKSFMSMKKSIKSDEKHFEKYVNKAIELQDGTVKVKISEIEDDESVAMRAYLKALSLLGVSRDIYKTHLEDINSLIKKDNGKYVCIKDGVCCFKEYDHLTFERNKEYFNQEFPVVCGNYITPDGVLILQSVPEFENQYGATFIDAGKIPSGAVIRKRADGDIFARASCSKKLKSYLIDRKVPQRERDELFVIAKDKTVFAVCTMECGKELMVTKDTKEIIKITYKKNRIYTEDKNV